MIRFFRSSFVAQYVVIVVTGLLLWTRAFIEPPQMPAPVGPVPLYKLIYLLLEQLPLVAVILGFLVTIFSAFFLNYLMTSHELVQKNSSLPAFIFVMLSGFYPQALTLHPVNICFVFILLILYRLFSVYRRSEPLDTTYSIGFMAAAGSMVCFPFLLLAIMVYIWLTIFRISGWREWLSTLFGLVTPFMFLFTYYFWFGIIPERATAYLQAFRINFPAEILKNSGFILLSSVFLLIMLISFFSGMGHLSEKTIEIRHKISVLVWTIPFLLIAIPFCGSMIIYYLLLTCIPVATLFSGYLLRLKKHFVHEVAIIIIFAAILADNLFKILY